MSGILRKIYFHNGELMLREHSLVFESSSAFTFSKESTFRTILGFEEDIESTEEDGKHIIRFNNVKQIHELETLRAEIKSNIKHLFNVLLYSRKNLDLSKNYFLTNKINN